MTGTTGEAKAYIPMLFILYALEFRDANEGAGSRSVTAPVARDQRSKVRIGEQLNRPACHCVEAARDPGFHLGEKTSGLAEMTRKDRPCHHTLMASVGPPPLGSLGNCGLSRATEYNGAVAMSRGSKSPTWNGVWLYLVLSSTSAVTPFVHVVYRDPSRAPRRQKDSSVHSSAHPPASPVARELYAVSGHRNL
ncbi:hypothetical protein NEUTE2DRAFT_133687 [Neurospora tetrasperma FGSC 2509]|nr:hypothetical protein NEUTE2DRAFT_133687 [Neurospora tetrasperma FGSC 2509]